VEGKPIEEKDTKELSETPRSKVINIDNKIIKDFE